MFKLTVDGAKSEVSLNGKPLDGVSKAHVVVNPGEHPKMHLEIIEGVLDIEMEPGQVTMKTILNGVRYELVRSG